MQIRTMRFADIPFAIRLTNQEKWGVTRSDLIRILTLDPAGSFIANEGSRKVGIITTTRYGRKLGWIGNVIVDRKHRGKRIGHSLVLEAVACLQQSKVEHIGLYCFNENVKFYRRLGFVCDAPFVRLRREQKQFRSSPLARGAYQRLPLRSVLASDKKGFGADRATLIRKLLRTKTAWYLGFSNGPNASSYLLVKEFKDMFELGPWICIDPPNGQPREMLSIALDRTTGKPTEASCFQHHPAFALLRKDGFRTMRKGYRMFLGKTPRLGRPQANYALGFLDKG